MQTSVYANLITLVKVTSFPEWDSTKHWLPKQMEVEVIEYLTYPVVATTGFRTKIQRSQVL
jgi:hypothetical protein